MVASQLLAMGNGSVKAPRAEENSCLPSIHADAPHLDSDILRVRITYLETELARRNQEFQTQELQLRRLQKELETKVSQIEKLQDAIHSHQTVGLSPTALCHHSCRHFSAINQGRFHKVAVEVHRRLRAKEGVSAEPPSADNFLWRYRPSSVSTARTVHKNSDTKRLINEAILSNDFLKKLEPQHMREMVDCMYEKVYSEGQLVIQEGDAGNYLYVLAEGLLEVIQNGKLLGEMHPGTAFGELAILYNCKRTATVKAVLQSHIWTLERQTFQTIMMQTTQARHQEYFTFLRSVSLLKQLPEEKLGRIVDCLEVEYFEKGEYIIREGEEGNTFFIIAKGQVTVTQSSEGFTQPQEIKTLGVGDYFGERALISEDVRSANIICNENDTQCLVVDRDNFNQMVGTYEELQTYLKEYVGELSKSDERRHFLPHSQQSDSPEAQELSRLRERTARIPANQPFQELEVIATLGMGGFGRVELVKLKDEESTFALKCIKKKHVVDTRQQQHIYSEKKILQQTNSSFIIRLFRTFRDNKYIYMLLEVCLGGELWTVLRDMSCFEEQTARFCIGCVLEAFDYLHSMGIIYRDLKPENLLLDADGYVKMADFGFAKQIGIGRKTWTFCGTPEYVAPEVIMNKGHDFGADCWSLGILVFELLTGNPPFSGSDPIKIYTMVLHGIDRVDFPKRIGKRPDDLIRRLCKLNPVERIGNKKNGIMDIKKHKWFQGFNWEGLQGRKLPSPLKRELSKQMKTSCVGFYCYNRGYGSSDTPELRGPMDHSNFDMFPPNSEEAPDELSGWDKDF